MVTLEIFIKKFPLKSFEINKPFLNDLINNSQHKDCKNLLSFIFYEVGIRQHGGNVPKSFQEFKLTLRSEIC